MRSIADGAACRVLSEGMPPPPTVQAIVTKAIRDEKKDSRKRIQSVEDQLENERKKVKKMERELALLQQKRHDPKVSWGPAVGAPSKKQRGTKSLKQQLPPQLTANPADSDEEGSWDLASPATQQKKPSSLSRKTPPPQAAHTSQPSSSLKRTPPNPYNRGPSGRAGGGQNDRGGRGSNRGRHQQRGRGNDGRGQNTVTAAEHGSSLEQHGKSARKSTSGADSRNKHSWRRRNKQSHKNDGP